jgi:hypothetical protein
MANDIGWGQGVVNNNIGWGQGACNNIINWGSIYLKSYSGETDIFGSIAPNLIINFKTSILNDSGTFEAESCLNTTLTNLNNI